MGADHGGDRRMQRNRPAAICFSRKRREHPTRWAASPSLRAARSPLFASCLTIWTQFFCAPIYMARRSEVVAKKATQAYFAFTLSGQDFRLARSFASSKPKYALPSDPKSAFSLCSIKHSSESMSRSVFIQLDKGLKLLLLSV
jgi:hypothetical protein